MRDVRCRPVPDDGQQGASRQVDGIVLFGCERRVRDKRRPEPSEKQDGCSSVTRRRAIEDFPGNKHRVNREADVERREAIQWPVVPNKETEHRVVDLVVEARCTDRHEEETEKSQRGQHDESGCVFAEFFPFGCRPWNGKQQQVGGLVDPNPTRIEADGVIDCGERQCVNGK